MSDGAQATAGDLVGPVAHGGHRFTAWWAFDLILMAHHKTRVTTYPVRILIRSSREALGAESLRDARAR